LDVIEKWFKQKPPKQFISYIIVSKANPAIMFLTFENRNIIGINH